MNYPEKRINKFKKSLIGSTRISLNNIQQSLSIKQTPKQNSKYLRYKISTASLRINVNRKKELVDLNKLSSKSFERNQSFPKIKRNYDNDLWNNDCNLKQAHAMEKIRVDGSNGLRFPLRHKRCHTPKQCASYNNSLIVSTSETTTLRDTKAGINPNKAVFTIDSKTSQILIVNNNACQLLNYTSRELTNMSFSELLTSTSKSHVCALAEVHLNCEDGTIVLLSGKVVEMNTKSNTRVAVSLWIRQIDNDGRCLAVAEPVERRVCQFVIDSTGLIQNADYESLIIFQFETLDKIIGMDITFLIPAIQLPNSDVIAKYVKKQKATGKTGDGIAFPLCLLLNPHNDVNTTDNSMSVNPNQYIITVWVFQNLSGLVVLDEYGTIESCNHHFSMLMFGYPQSKIINQSITKLIPHFGEYFEYIDFSRSRNVTVSSLDKSLESGTETDAVCLDSTEVLDDNEIHLDENMKNFDFDVNQEQEKSFNDNRTEIDENFTPNELLTPVNDNSDHCYNLSQNNDFISLNDPLTPTYSKDLGENLKLITSTPADDLQTDVDAHKIHNYADGKYKGEAIHSDGNIIDILYTVSNQQLPCGRKVYCVWICRDPDTVYAYDEIHQNLTLTFNSINSTIEHSLGQAIKNTAAQNYSRPNSVLLTSQYEDDQWLTNGDYNKFYTTLKQIGKGAYGYVKMAYKNSDRLLVVSKFILKDKLCPQFLITDDHKEIPMEIYLLTRIKHPNIVSVLDVFENEKFFQLVMEKHGSGMDLFEFIDRRPLMDESLASYIFRQIIDAVDYLHKNSILHRDIKDENIIIDHNFHIKLIDFGSATYMEEGKLFSTFFGTTEYCSPEVLAGNKYAGPELEIWSLGVTLYVLIFFENPFIDIEETLKADLIFPNTITVQLENLLISMLDKDPSTRCTMKELTENNWITQDINPIDFNFSQIVPCEIHEAKPEKYFSEQIQHINIGTISPQNSSSLADGDSIIDGDVDDDNGGEIEMSPVISGDIVTSNLADMIEDNKLYTTNDIRNESNNEYLTEKQNDPSSSGKESQKIEQKHNSTVSDIKLITQLGGDSRSIEHDYINKNLNTKICFNCAKFLNQNVCSTSTISLYQTKNKFNNINYNNNFFIKNSNENNEYLIRSYGYDTKKKFLNLNKKCFSCGDDIIFNKNKFLFNTDLSRINVSDYSINCGNNNKLPFITSSSEFIISNLITQSNEQQQCYDDNNMKRKSCYDKLFNKTNEFNFNSTNLRKPQLLSASKSENNIFQTKLIPKLAIYEVVSLNDLNNSDPFLNNNIKILSCDYFHQT